MERSIILRRLNRYKCYFTSKQISEHLLPLWPITRRALVTTVFATVFTTEIKNRITNIVKTNYNMNDKDIFNIKELIKFLEDNHTKENGYKFQIRVIVNKTLNGKFKVINLTQDGFDKVSNVLYSLIQKDIDDDTEDLISLDLTKNRL